MSLPEEEANQVVIQRAEKGGIELRFATPTTCVRLTPEQIGEAVELLPDPDDAASIVPTGSPFDRMIRNAKQASVDTLADMAEEEEVALFYFAYQHPASEAVALTRKDGAILVCHDLELTHRCVEKLGNLAVARGLRDGDLGAVAVNKNLLPRFDRNWPQQVVIKSLEQFEAIVLIDRR